MKSKKNVTQIRELESTSTLAPPSFQVVTKGSPPPPPFRALATKGACASGVGPA